MREVRGNCETWASGREYTGEAQGKVPGGRDPWDEWEPATACLRLEEEPQAAGPGSALVHRSLTQLKEAVRPTLRSDRWS